MRASDDAQRTIGIYATRYLFDRNERYACPGIAERFARVPDGLQHIVIAPYRAPAALDLIPYATVSSRQHCRRARLKAGADLSWKPSPNLWLTATLNPDFGQVESDELVVDFSAVETVFTDKRPFFTENHGIFDVSTPANGQLVYTRRVGSAPDDGSDGSSDIDGALKTHRYGASAVVRCLRCARRRIRRGRRHDVLPRPTGATVLRWSRRLPRDLDRPSTAGSRCQGQCIRLRRSRPTTGGASPDS